MKRNSGSGPDRITPGRSRKLGDQWESEAFHNMKLNAHGSILQFSTNAEGRMVHDGPVLNLLARGLGHGENPPGAVPGFPPRDGGYHTLSAAWDVNRKEWFDIFGKDARATRGLGALDGPRHELEHAVRVVPHVPVP